MLIPSIYAVTHDQRDPYGRLNGTCSRQSDQPVTYQGSISVLGAI